MTFDLQNQPMNTTMSHLAGPKSCFSNKLFMVELVAAGSTKLAGEQESETERQQSAATDHWSGLLFIFILLQIKLINAALTTFASGSSASASDLINTSDTLQPAFHAKPLFLSTPLNHALKSCCTVGHSPVNHTWNQNLTGQWTR